MFECAGGSERSEMGERDCKETRLSLIERCIADGALRTKRGRERKKKKKKGRFRRQ